MARTTGTMRTGSSKSQDAAEMIRKKAYELYEKRGKKPGHAMDDWLEAERIVRQKSF
jgi:hypothetical protein